MFDRCWLEKMFDFFFTERERKRVPGTAQQDTDGQQNAAQARSRFQPSHCAVQSRPVRQIAPRASQCARVGVAVCASSRQFFF